MWFQMLKYNLPGIYLGMAKNPNLSLLLLFVNYITTVVLSANLSDTPSPLHPSCWVKVTKYVVLYGNCRWSQSTKNPHLHHT